MYENSIKTPKCLIEIYGKEYELVFTLYVVSEIAERFDGNFEEVFNAMSSDVGIKEIAYVLMLLLNEGIYLKNKQGEKIPEFTQRDVLSMLKMDQITEVVEKITKVIVDGTPAADPNVQTTQKAMSL